jgi:hypothetical protein
MLTLARLLLAGCLVALCWWGSALAGDRQGLEGVPPSCRQLHSWQEKCRTGPADHACNISEIEKWRARCKADSTRR